MSSQNRLRYSDSVEGVDVEKRYDEAEFPFPSIVYELSSTRDEPVVVTVADVLPDAIDAADVGFHADYNGEHWAVEGNRLVFERELGPEEGCRTIYAVSATGTEEPSEIFVEPSVVDVSPPAAGDTASLDLSEPAKTDGAGGETRTESEPASPDDVLSALAAELERDDVDRADLEVLASAVAEAMADASGSVEARVARIESDVAELRAYSDALADFLDEHGGARPVIEGFEERVSTVESEVDTLRSRTEDLDGDVDSLETTTGDLDAEIDSVAESLDALAEDLDDLRASVGHQGEGPSVDDRLADLEDRVTEFEDFVGSVRAAFD